MIELKLFALIYWTIVKKKKIVKKICKNIIMRYNNYLQLTIIIIICIYDNFITYTNKKEKNCNWYRFLKIVILKIWTADK